MSAWWLRSLNTLAPAILPNNIQQLFAINTKILAPSNPQPTTKAESFREYHMVTIPDIEEIKQEW